jgi:NTE family protein
MTTPLIAMILQGGGALGAYQAGVFEQLRAHDFAPDWIIGTSIGAISGAIIAGNPPGQRTEKLRAFWDGMAPAASWADLWSPVGWAEAFNPFAALMGAATKNSAVLGAMAQGIDGFFKPRFGSGWDLTGAVPIAQAGFYDTAPLRQTLIDLVDFDYLNDGKIRLSVSAVDIATGELVVFDTKGKGEITPEHIMASGALPPAFPPVVIDGRAYWDGGLHSNTPLEILLCEAPSRDALVFMIDLWDPSEALPTTMAEVMARQKAIQYSSRMDQQLKIDQRLEALQQAIRSLSMLVPADIISKPETAKLAAMGCDRTVQVIRLVLQTEAHADQYRDVDFSTATVRARWAAGSKDANRALKHKAWLKPVPPHAGLIIHELEQE